LSFNVPLSFGGKHRQGRTALGMCVEDEECSSRDHFSRENRVAVIETLLAHGADPNSKDKVVHEKLLRLLLRLY
jgi:hypothetical protein